VAPTLLQIFPQMKMIHMVRDGRDVACSLAARSWGPNSVARGVRWWAKRMRRADAGERGLPADRLLVVNLEDLVERDREGTYGRVLEFLRVEDEPKIRRYFDKKLTPENANIGRWRSDLSEARQRRLTDSYARTLKRLSAAGVSSTPALEAAEGAGPPR
jgi:hypothetical protein